MLPPAPASFGLSDRVPARFVFELDISEQPVGLPIKEDRVIAHTMRLEHSLKLRPDRVVPLAVLRLGAAIDRHDEGFSDHPDSDKGLTETRSSMTACTCRRCVSRKCRLGRVNRPR